MGASKRMVVTGLGIVDGSAWGARAAARAFMEGRIPPTTEVDRTAGYHKNCRASQALLVDRGPMSQWISPLARRRMSSASQFAVCAAKMAVEDAGLALSETGARTAVVLATAFGAVRASEEILRQLFLEGPEAVSPSAFAESVANAPAAQVALALGSRAANITVPQRQASTSIALAMACSELEAGSADRVLVGAVDEMSPLLHSILDQCGALAQPDSEGVELARPFDLRRNGWLAAEGAVVAVLESEAVARQRGAIPRARVLGAGSAFDPRTSALGWSKRPEVLADRLRKFLDRLDVGLNDINRLVSGASGHLEGDQIETGLLRSVWDSAALPPVIAPSAVSGAYVGAVLSSAVLAAEGVAFGPTPGFATPDPELGMTPHDGRALSPPKLTLLTTCAQGGAASWAVLGRADL